MASSQDRHLRLFVAAAFALVSCKTRQADSGALEMVTNSSAGIVTGIGAQTVVLAGGASEGEIEERESWSYNVYKQLILNCPSHDQEDQCIANAKKGEFCGDTDHDGVVRVYAISAFPDEDLEWLPSYFEWIGKSLGIPVESKTFKILTREEADDPAKASELCKADAIFVKGGNQADQYRAWNETLLESCVHKVVEERHGAIGGTSAGPITLAAFANLGGRDFSSDDFVRSSARTAFMEEENSQITGIKSDFMPVVPGAVVDTHTEERARLGRVMGLLARASLDYQRRDILAIGVGTKTAMILHGTDGKIVGENSVFVLHPTPESVIKWDENRAPIFTNVSLDFLVDGYRFDLGQHAVTFRPPQVSVVSNLQGSRTKGIGVVIRGDVDADGKKFHQTYVPTNSDNYAASTKTCEGEDCLPLTFGVTRADDKKTRESKLKSLLRAIYEAPGTLGVIMYPGSVLTMSKNRPGVLMATSADASKDHVATLFVDSSKIAARGLSTFWGPLSKAVPWEDRAVALEGLRLHSLGDSDDGGPSFSLSEQSVVMP